MAPLPAPGNDGSSGNALQDANSAPPPGTKYAVTDPAAARQAAQVNAALNAVNQQIATTAADCLWPPSAQVTIPIVPGLYSQSFQLGCLISYSEARAVAGAGILVAGLLIMFAGVQTIVVLESAGLILRLVGVGGGGGKKPAGGAAAGEEAAVGAGGAGAVALAA